MKLIHLLLSIIILVGCSSMSSKSTIIKTKDVPNLKATLFAAISGDVSQSLAEINGLSIKELSTLEKDIVEKYRKRFNKSSELNLIGNDEFVFQVINSFRMYWKKALLGEINELEGYKYLYNELVPLSKEKGYVAKDFSEDEFKRLGEFLEKELKKDGYHTLFGRVKPLLNIMVWRKEYESTFDVEIGESSKQKVSVVFMDDFLELGWGAFATFEVMFVGGWANKEKLFCVKPAYDTSSENFQVSYLAHEARHFADYKIFPKLDQVDLEYRAKLTEILVSDSTYNDVIDKFIHEQKNDRSSPHAYASYLIVKNLSAKLETKNFQEIDKSLVQQIVRELINHHTQAATAKKADIVETIF